jgi:hypothetical protein
VRGPRVRLLRDHVAEDRNRLVEIAGRDVRRAERGAYRLVVGLEREVSAVDRDRPLGLVALEEDAAEAAERVRVVLVALENVLERVLCLVVVGRIDLRRAVVDLREAAPGGDVVGCGARLLREVVDERLHLAGSCIGTFGWSGGRSACAVACGGAAALPAGRAALRPGPGVGGDGLRPPPRCRARPR